MASSTVAPRSGVAELQALLDSPEFAAFASEHARWIRATTSAHSNDGCEDRGVPPIMPLRLTPAVKAGADDPPTCEHGRWQFAGSDYKRKASKWRCPTGECKPASR